MARLPIGQWPNFLLDKCNCSFGLQTPDFLLPTKTPLSSTHLSEMAQKCPVFLKTPVFPSLGPYSPLPW